MGGALDGRELGKDPWLGRWGLLAGSGVGAGGAPVADLHDAEHIWQTGGVVLVHGTWKWNPEKEKS